MFGMQLDLQKSLSGKTEMKKEEGVKEGGGGKVEGRGEEKERERRNKENNMRRKKGT